MSGYTGIANFIKDKGFYCENCGRFHSISLDKLIIERGAVNKLPLELAALHVTKPFILTDSNLSELYGDQVKSVLDKAGVKYTFYALSSRRPMPDEKAVGEAVERYDRTCDGIIALGGGVVNDICKILTNLTGKPFIYCPTAASMDGMASSSSSMDALGLKTSIPSTMANVIIADADIIASAPVEMTVSGIGDITAKYVSLVEWKLSHIINDEYYCPEIAAMVEKSLSDVVSAGPKASKGDPGAIGAVVEGLILAGLCMTACGLTRPASGMEHYISHIRDMRSLAFGTRVDFHGIQAGFGVHPCLCGYEKLKKITPNREKALAHAAAFDYKNYAAQMREFVGPGADSMIANEAKEGKYDVKKHAARLETIISKWDELVAVMNELPSAEEYKAFCKSIGFPTEISELGISEEEFRGLVKYAGDIRDKYVMARLFWDLGEEM